MKDAITDGSIHIKSSYKAFDFIVQFLFQELRYTDNVRKWILRKLNLEFAEMINQTTTGKLFSQISVSI